MIKPANAGGRKGTLRSSLLFIKIHGIVILTRTINMKTIVPNPPTKSKVLLMSNPVNHLSIGQFLFSQTIRF